MRNKEYDPNKRLFLKKSAQRILWGTSLIPKKGDTTRFWRWPHRWGTQPKESQPQYVETNTSIKGEATWYDRAHCLGCRPDFLMANGDVLDDSIPTLACNDLAINSMVNVTNLENGLSTIAQITDTGGFGGEQIADLNIATAELIDFPFDAGHCTVQLTVLQRTG